MFKLKEETSKVLHLEHSLCGAETWIVRKEDQNYLEISEMWCRRRMEKIIWTDRVKNEKALH
jgi:hypothetical protein